MSQVSRISLLLVLLFCIGACAEQPKDKKIIHHGKIPPLRLEPDTTFVHLDDILPSEVRVDSVYSESDIILNLKDRKLEIISNEENDWIGALRLVSGDSILDVPLYFSTQQRWEFFFPDPSKKYTQVNLVGDINAWDPNETPLEYKEGNWQTELWLKPGNYGYQLVIDGEMQRDPYNEEVISNGMGGLNSLLQIGGISPDRKPQIYFQEEENNAIIHSSLPNSQYLAFWNNMIIPIREKRGHVMIEVPQMANDYERSYIRVYAQNEHARSNDLLIPLDSGKILDSHEDLLRSDIHAMRLYFLMVDRFYNGTTENDQPTDDPGILPIANFKGGDIQGVLQKMQDGYFDRLNMNSLWLSPIPKNPEGAYGLWNKGGVRSEFSAYHGYWPISFTEIDPRFGNKQSLKELIQYAHEQEKNILLDFVANHVHEQHPVYQANKDWATELYLPDGSLNTRKWDEHRLTTWFDTFLPTLDLEKQEAAEMLSDSALYWLKEYELDGFRHDATKHIPLNFWRSLTDKVRKYEQDSGRTVFQIGESYGTAELIGSYLGYGLLDAQFDFNMYDQLVGALTTEEGDFKDVAEQIEESMAYYGHHHLMGNMSGNQDKPRFMSLATGEVSVEEDTKLAGWTREINEQNEKGFARLGMMHAFNFSLPGIPVVYYGDEIGMPGGNDPDNRRMMKFDDISDQEKELRDKLSQLSNIRSLLLPLQWGTTEIMRAEKDLLIIMRRYDKEAALIIFNKGAEIKNITVELPTDRFNGTTSYFSGNFSLQGDQLHIGIPAESFDIVSLKRIENEK